MIKSESSIPEWNNNNDCRKTVECDLIVQPDFERLYQNLSTNISDIDYLASEILSSLSKFREINVKETQPVPQKEPVGIIETFEDRINYMSKIRNRLEDVNSTLKKLV